MGRLVGVALVAVVGGAGGVGAVHGDGVHVSVLEEARSRCHDPDQESYRYLSSSNRCLFSRHHLGISTTQSAHILKA